MLDEQNMFLNYFYVYIANCSPAVDFYLGQKRNFLESEITKLLNLEIMSDYKKNYDEWSKETYYESTYAATLQEIGLMHYILAYKEDVHYWKGEIWGEKKERFKDIKKYIFQRIVNNQFLSYKDLMCIDKNDDLIVYALEELIEEDIVEIRKSDEVIAREKYPKESGKNIIVDMTNITHYYQWEIKRSFC